MTGSEMVRPDRAPARSRGAAIPLVCLYLLIGGCATEPPVLQVGELGFPSGALSGVPGSAMAALADVAAWGLLVRDARVDSLLEPIAAQAAERSRAGNLPLVLGARALGIDEAQLRAHYEAQPQWELEVRHVIRMADAGAPLNDRIRALEEAEAVLARARAGEDFAALAAEFSEEPGAAARGGLLQPGRRGSWVAPFWDAAATLRPGEISPVVESEYGFHVLQLVDRRPVPFEEADRAALLRQVVSAPAAAAAMADWSANAAEPRVEESAGALAWNSLLAGRSPGGETLAVAGTHRYTGDDLVLAWAALEPRLRRGLRTDSSAFRAWWQADAADLLTGRAAAGLGAPVDPAAGATEMARLRGLAAVWTRALGFQAGMAPDALMNAAVAGVTRSGQEVAIARSGLEGLRPLLRAARPVSQPG